MQMPGRVASSTSYRYGFNGKENDNEVKGTGNQQDYGMRIYDPRLGRFLSVDPLTTEYPELTPYQFASNRPIDGIDWDGKEWRNIGKYFNADDGKFHDSYNITLSLNYSDNTLHLNTDENVLMEIKTKAENMLSNKTASGSLHDPIIDVNINLTEDAGAFEVRFFDLEDNLNFNGRTGRLDHTTNATDPKGYYGKTHLPGNSQSNVVEVALSTTFTTTSNGKILRNEQKIRTTDEIARTLSHELGHTAGLQHPFSPLRKEKDVSNTPALCPFPSQEATKDVLNNLMNSEGNIKMLRSMTGTELLPSQRTKIKETVNDQQPKS